MLIGVQIVFALEAISFCARLVWSIKLTQKQKLNAKAKSISHEQAARGKGTVPQRSEFACPRIMLDNIL
jgi:hypothetical protein